MFLSDVELRRFTKEGRIVISPFDDGLIRGGSICLRLGMQFMPLSATQELDCRVAETYPACSVVEADRETGYSIPPNEFVLGTTLEKISIPLDMAAWMSNLSGLARLGLQVVFSQFVGPGYGELKPSALTLELFNALKVPIRVYPGMRICHLVFLRANTVATAGYDTQVGTYAQQDGPRASRFYSEFHNRTPGARDG